jgi:ferritin
MSKTMEAAFNVQINAELYNSHLYLSMAAYFEGQDLKGMARYYRRSSKGERNHAMKLFDFAADRSWAIALTTVAMPAQEWGSPLAALQAAYQTEQDTTAKIKTLISVSEDEADFESYKLLEWFANEQVSEEADAELWVTKCKFVTESGGTFGLYMLDREMGKAAK